MRRLLGIAVAEEVARVVDHVTRDTRRLEDVVQAPADLGEIARVAVEETE